MGSTAEEKAAKKAKKAAKKAKKEKKAQEAAAAAAAAESSSAKRKAEDEPMSAKKATKKLTKKLGRAPTEAEIAAFQAKKAKKAKKASAAEPAPAAAEAEAEPAAPSPVAAAPAAAEGSEEIRKCFLGNLPYSIEDDNVREFFKDVGEITDIHWLTDKESGQFYGSGFIEFGTHAEAKAAVAKAGEDLMGRPLKVDLAKPRAPRAGGAGGAGGGGFKKKPFEVKPLGPKPDGCNTVFMGNLSYQIDEDAVKDFFKDCGGEIVNIRWLTDRETGDFKVSHAHLSGPEPTLVHSTRALRRAVASASSVPRMLSTPSWPRTDRSSWAVRSAWTIPPRGPRNSGTEAVGLAVKRSL